MNKLESALGGQFTKNKNAVRTRSFFVQGVTFKVKIPLTKEFEEMKIRMEIIDESIVENYYQEIIKKSEKDLALNPKLVIDSPEKMMEQAKNRHVTEINITEMFKLLVPEESGFDMSTITYDEIDELFPKPIQLEMIHSMNNVLSPTYMEVKEK